MSIPTAHSVFPSALSNKMENPVTVTGPGELRGSDITLLVQDVMGKIGVKSTQSAEIVFIGESGFVSVSKLTITGHSPLRATILLRARGYETYRPEPKRIAGAYEFFGDLDCHTVYLLETLDGFILAHEDKMLGYRSCQS